MIYNTLIPVATSAGKHEPAAGISYQEDGTTHHKSSHWQPFLKSNFKYVTSIEDGLWTDMA